MIGAWPGVIRLLRDTGETMREAMRSDLPIQYIDPRDPALRRYLIASMGSLPDERLHIFFLDSACGLIADEQVQQGSLAQLALYPRTLFRRALEHNAAAIILVHNHPSGDPRPSRNDIRTTHRLAQIGRDLEVTLLDHIVVTAAGAHYLSDHAETDARPARASFILHNSPGKASAKAASVENARATIRRRLLRRQLLDAPDLFGEPAWDMILDLFVHGGEGRPIAMSSVCVSAGIPFSSAMRLVQKLCDAGILRRVPDIFDGRRINLSIAPDVGHRLRAYFAEGPE